MFFILILLAGVGITNLIVNATILDYPRNFIVERSNFFGTLVTCMMCSGFWVGIILGLFTGTPIVLLGAAISLLSYTFGILIDYLQVLSAVKATELSDGEEDVE